MDWVSKTKSILIHNIMTNIKGINAIGIKDNIEINIDQNFMKKTLMRLRKN